MTDTKQCPCDSGVLYTDCCEGVLSGQRKAASAEALMRSRYTAYVNGDLTYVLQTWHPSTRPTAIDPAAIPDWCHLEIIQTKRGKAEDHVGIVEFQATARPDGKILKLHEISRFVKEGGEWLYVSGKIIGDLPPVQPKAGKVGRNCLCPCGSGKKFKKCCSL